MPESTATAPAAAPAAAPPKPAPTTPAKPAAAAPATTPAKPPTPDYYNELDEMAAAGDAKGAPKKESGQASPPTPAKTGAKDSPAKSADGSSPDGKPAPSTPKPEDSATSDVSKPAEPPKSFRAAELRTAYDNLKANHKQVQEKLAALTAEHEKLKSSKAEDPDKPKLVEAIKAKDEELEKLRQELKWRAYETTDEYRQRYQQPYEDAYKMGREAAAELTVSDSEGNQRQGQPQDFDAIMLAGTTKNRSALARAMFGEDALTIIAHAQEVQRLYQSGQRAIETYKSQGAEREKQTAAERAKQEEAQTQAHKEVSGIYQQSIKEAVEKYPDWFKPQEGDTADSVSNELLQKGMALADSAFGPPTNMTPQTLARIRSVVHNKAGAFDRVVHDYKVKLATAEAHIKDLETQLAEFQESVPGQDSGRRGKEAHEMTADEELESLDRR